ncbi:response regulator [Burkholderia sp. Ac-20345]|nr:response regulator [Burkholderia sp. Ac-20345]
MLGARVALAADLPWPQAVDIAAVSSEQSLATDVMQFDDASHELDASTVQRLPDWHPATARSLSRGFTRSAVWIAGTLVNRGQGSVTRWLSVDPLRLEDVSFYVVTDAGTMPEKRYQSGVGSSLSARPIETVRTVFPVTLLPGQKIRYLIRAQSRSSLTLSIRLWLPSAFREAEMRAVTGHMLLTGTMLAMAVFSAVLGVTWRDRVFVLLTATVIGEVVYELAFEGYLYVLWLRHGGDWVLRLPGVAGDMSVVLFSSLLMSFMGFGRFRAWRWIYLTMVTVLSGAAVWTAFGDYRTAASVSIQLTFACNLVWIASIADGWRRGIPNARLILVAFLPDFTTLLARLAVIAGIIPPEWNAGTAQIWDSVGVLVLLSLVIGGRARQLLIQQRQAQRALLAEREATRIGLEHAVATRTHELREALVRADDAVRAKTDFLARISHDLRTPLTSIIGFADLIQAAGRTDAERGRIIRRSADHMLGMVNDLIDYASGRDADALSPSTVYTYALLDTVSQHGSALAARRGNTFSVDVVGDLPPVIELDDRRMQQVLGNLLDNAAKFTDHGAIRLAVSARIIDTAGRRWSLRFVVADSGCGIAMGDQERVFDPFVRALKNDYRPGIGLGLSIVKLWTGRMGATVQLESTPGAGTTFVIELVVSEMDESAIGKLRMHEAADALPRIDGRGHRVLIAEDTAEIRALLRDDLSSLGFDVEVYGNGTSAIRRLTAQDGTSLALVVTDLSMPGASGQEVLLAARDRHPRIPVVLMSAVPFRQSAAKEQFDAHLHKPVSLADLRNTIATLLNLPREHHRVLSAAIDIAMLKRPAQDLMDEGRMLVELGAVSDLLDWAGKVVSLDPACMPFAEQIRRAAARGELDELQSMFTDTTHISSGQDFR